MLPALREVLSRFVARTIGSPFAKPLARATLAANLAAARSANLTSRKRSIWAMALYVGALGVLGAQVLLIAIVHLLGI